MEPTLEIAVRTRIESSFCPEARTGAGEVVHRGPRPSRLNPCQPRPGMLAMLRRAQPDIFEDVLAAVIAS
jgi:hypothetical protein